MQCQGRYALETRQNPLNNDFIVFKFYMILFIILFVAFYSRFPSYVIFITFRTLLISQTRLNRYSLSINVLIVTQGQRIREIYAQIPASTGTLGLSLQWTALSATEDVWHILDVIPNSPADHAGLLPYGDYVIGSPEGIVRGESGLGELVEDVCFLRSYPNSPFHPI